MANKGFTIIVTTIAALAFVGCKTSSGGRSATAQLAPTQGNQVHGTVKFTETAAGVRVVAHVQGLTPGQHGFHVHEKGDCSAPDATSAGSHFNPGGASHGMPDAAQRHIGDLGNITADASGKAHYDRVDKHLRFDGPNSILGRSVIVHAKPDDGGQPVGNAGARVACGVIK